MEDVTAAERARQDARLSKKSATVARRAFLIRVLVNVLAVGIALTYVVSEWRKDRQKTAEARQIAIHPPIWGDWKEDMHIGIARALVKAQAKGCGQLKWRADTIHRGQYLVRCTKDGREWFEWHVDEYKGTARGPHFLNPDND